MNGSRYLLDTNAIVALIKGNSTILELTAHADFVYLSVINIIEFLSFTNLPENDRILFQEFIQETELLNLSAENTSLINSVCNLRKLHRLKLPDAIIDAQAIYNKATIITADKHLMELIT
jgi:predicted nucleic acid-binding protein